MHVALRFKSNTVTAFGYNKTPGDADFVVTDFRSVAGTPESVAVVELVIGQDYCIRIASASNIM